MIVGLKYLDESLNVHAPLPKQTAVMMSLLAGIRNDLKGRVPVAERYSYYLQGMLLSGQGDGDRALPYLAKALKQYKSVETGLNIVSMLATHKHFRQARTMLDQSAKVLESQPDSKLIRTRKTYKQEIARLRRNLNDDIAKQSLQSDARGKRGSRKAKSPANAKALVPSTGPS
jgi:hypothetical protein